MLKKYEKYKLQVLITFVSTIIALVLLSMIIERELPTLGIPNIVGNIISIILCYIYYTTNKAVIKIIFFITSFVICVSYYFYGFKCWLNYLNYNHFSEKVNIKVSPNWKTYLPSDFIVSNDQLILFDCFNTSCGICFKKFPILQKLYTNNSDSNLLIYAVNVPIKRDTPSMALNMVRMRKYTFPVLVAKNKFDSVFDINGYPTVFLIKNNAILYKGSIDNVQTVIEEYRTTHR